MANNIAEEIVNDLKSVCQLHQQAVCNHDKCREFSESLSGLLVKLEDMKFYRMADRAMSILLTANQKRLLTVKKQTLSEN